MNCRYATFGIVCVIALVGIVFLFLQKQERIEPRAGENKQHIASPIPLPTPSESPIILAKNATTPPAQSANQKTSIKLFSAASLYGASSPYDFSMYIPADWKAEVIPRSESINIFDPSVSSTRTLESSQVFIRYVKASTFLTLSSVKILSRKEFTVTGRPAVEYLIEKKKGYPDFPNQPSWRNQQHTVIDIRASDAPESIFYVFAKRPDLPYDVFTAILETIVFSPKDLLFHPIDDFPVGIIKKPFGIFITPTNSPISPEKFTGYHAGADVEINESISATAQIPIYAIADGVVVKSGKAQGYGGVIAIRHSLHEEVFVAVYGHLNPRNLVPQGRTVKAGQVIGYLGKAFSPETDGERRHLHFGMHKGDAVTIVGYAFQQSDLAQWQDPAEFFREHMK